MKNLKQKLLWYYVLWRSGGLARVLQYRRDVVAVKDLARVLREMG